MWGKSIRCGGKTQAAAVCSRRGKPGEGDRRPAHGKSPRRPPPSPIPRSLPKPSANPFPPKRSSLFLPTAIRPTVAAVRAPPPRRSLLMAPDRLVPRTQRRGPRSPRHKAGRETLTSAVALLAPSVGIAAACDFLDEPSASYNRQHPLRGPASQPISPPLLLTPNIPVRALRPDERQPVRELLHSPASKTLRRPPSKPLYSIKSTSSSTSSAVTLPAGWWHRARVRSDLLHPNPLTASGQADLKGSFVRFTGRIVRFDPTHRAVVRTFGGTVLGVLYHV